MAGRRGQQDLVRGGANTIAVLGVQDQCGPWAQGGRATVRPLTQQPYLNGPDGFGSGQADGMVAGMADGSVRFLSKNIDPHVMEQLAIGPRRRAGRLDGDRAEAAGIAELPARWRTAGDPEAQLASDCSCEIAVRR